MNRGGRLVSANDDWNGSDANRGRFGANNSNNHVKRSMKPNRINVAEVQTVSSKTDEAVPPYNNQNGLPFENNYQTEYTLPTNERYARNIPGVTINTETAASDLFLSKRVAAFSEDISVVGLKYTMIKGGSLFRKLVWLSLVLSGLGFMAYQIYSQITLFQTRPTIIDLKVKTNHSLPFPTVTICNENMVSLKTAKMMGIEGLVARMNPPFPMSGWEPDFSGMEFNNKTNWTQLYTKMAQSLDEAVLELRWKSIPAKRTLMKMVPTNMGSGCFQFNGKGHDFRVTRAGSQHGLQIVLYCNQKDYLATNSPSAGFRILLHNEDEFPFMKEWAFKVTSGTHSLVAMRYENLTHLPHPYTDCNPQKNYTQAKCRIMCLTNYTITKCGCRHVYQPGDARVCYPNEVYLCAYKAERDFDTLNIMKNCSCPMECNERHYRYSVSGSHASDFFLSFMERSMKKPASYIKKNYALVDIFMSSMSYEDLNTKPGYTVLSLFCDIGGAMGLVLGATMLTLFEIVDFLTTTCAEFLLYRQGKKSEAARIKK